MSNLQFKYNKKTAKEQFNQLVKKYKPSQEDKEKFDWLLRICLQKIEKGEKVSLVLLNTIEKIVYNVIKIDLESQTLYLMDNPEIASKNKEVVFHIATTMSIITNNGDLLFCFVTENKVYSLTSEKTEIIIEKEVIKKEVVNNIQIKNDPNSISKDKITKIYNRFVKDLNDYPKEFVNKFYEEILR